MTRRPGPRRTAVYRTIRWGILAVLAGLGVASIGLTPAIAISAAILVAAVGLVWTGLPIDTPIATAPVGVDPRPGTRADASWLAWGLSSRGNGVGNAGAGRVRSHGYDRLARHGLDPEDPADRAELQRRFGPRAWRVIAATDARGVTLASVEQCLDVLDALDEERGRIRP